MGKNANSLVKYYNIPTLTDNNYNQYCSYVCSIPSLTDEEEKKLIDDYHIRKNINAAKQLTLHYLKFVVKIVNENRGYNFNKAELIQEGNIGLMIAIKKFNPKKNVKLSTYAIWWIKAKIREYLFNNLKIVNLTKNSNMKKLFFKYRDTNKNNDLSTSKLSEKLNVSQNDIVDIQNYFNHNSIENITHSNENDEEYDNENIYNSSEFEDNNPELTIIEDESRNIKNKKLQEFFNSLNERDVDILRSRYIDDKKITLSQLAKKWNISIERVRQIENETINKLKSTLKLEKMNL